MAASTPKTIAFIGDTHCGSLWGLHPEPQNRGQAYLAACWKYLLKTWPKRIDLLVLMGDLIDGKQKKSDGTGLTTGYLNKQTDLAIECLTPLVKRSGQVVRVDGTPYHEDFHGVLEKLDERFSIKLKDQVLDLDLGGRVLNVAHHPSGGSALYAGTKVDRENLWSMIAAHEGHVPDARWIVRAHIHMFIMQQTRRRFMLQTPCFQLQTPYAKKSNLYRWQPSLGGVLMLADDRADGGYIFAPTLFDTPMPEIHKLAGPTGETKCAD